MIPQIVMIVLFAMSLGISAATHGKPKDGNNSFFLSLLSVVIQVAILWWGGFFSVFWR